MRVLTSVLEMEFCTKRRALVASCEKSRVLNKGVFCFCMGWEVSTGTLRSGSAASSMRLILESVFVFSQWICVYAAEPNRFTIWFALIIGGMRARMRANVARSLDLSICSFALTVHRTTPLSVSWNIGTWEGADVGGRPLVLWSELFISLLQLISVARYGE